MNKQTVEILKQTAPVALLKGLPNLLSKEEYKDGDICNYFGVNGIDEENQRNYLKSVEVVKLSNHYDFGETDLSLLREAQQFVEKTKKRTEKEKEEKSRPLQEEETIQYWIEKGDKEKIKEAARNPKNSHKEFYQLMVENPEKKALILEALFELYEEGAIDEIEEIVITAMNTEKEQEELKQLLQKRNVQFKEERANIEYLQTFYKVYHEEFHWDSGMSEEEFYQTYSFKDFISVIAPTMNNLFNKGVFESDNWEEIEIDGKVANELDKAEKLGIVEGLYVAKRSEHTKTLGELVSHLFVVLQNESLECVDIYWEFEREIVEFFGKLKQNLTIFEEYIEKEIRINRLIEFVEVIDGQHQDASQQEKEKFFMNTVRNGVCVKEEVLTVFVEKLVKKEGKAFVKEFFKNNIEEFDKHPTNVLNNYLFEEEINFLKQYGIEVTYFEKQNLFKALLLA